ncbi:MAG: PQQ-binding-like beta-propeller repeat protein, partial [Actinomycetota bacterium]
GQLWSSPVVVDDTLIQSDCQGGIHAFDLATDGGPERAPEKRWSIQLGGCLESTPAVWDGRIYVGSRDGNFYAVADCSEVDDEPCRDTEGDGQALGPGPNDPNGG